jgi:endoglucanase
MATGDPEVSEGIKGNCTWADVHTMDFSTFGAEGRYRLCVAGIGCSFPFRISDVLTWRKAFVHTVRGAYHQRSGIALGGEHTAIERPRPYHPDDGVLIYHSTATLAETGNGLTGGDNFEVLVGGKTEEIVADAWGGHFDAGDWDRRIQHLRMVRVFFEIYELFPDYIGAIELNIPESRDGIPDVVDEGLWSLDHYRRMQTPEGGIRGGIEAAEHPNECEASWQESLDIMAYAPGVWSSYIYAGAAARAAFVLELAGADSERVAPYRESAEAAMQWAESQPAPGWDDEIAEQRSLAAVELYRLTGDDSYHQIFLATTAFASGSDTQMNCGGIGACDAAFVYVRTEHASVDSAAKQNCLDSLVGNADWIIAETTEKTAFQWSLDHPWVPIVWGLGPSVPKGVSLLRAHLLTGEGKYLRAAALSAQFALGANPTNLSFTTGLGQRNPRNPLLVDVRHAGIPVWPGINVFGFHETPDDWMLQWFLRPSGAHPDPDGGWPLIERFFDMFNLPPYTEFTVQQALAPSAFVFGYLAAVEH